MNISVLKSEVMTFLLLFFLYFTLFILHLIDSKKVEWWRKRDVIGKGPQVGI